MTNFCFFASGTKHDITFAMKGTVLGIITISAIACFLLVSCGNGGVSENHRNRGLNPGVGPFDSRGNYVESWADDPRKGVAWRPERVVGKSSKKKKLAKTKVKPTPAIQPPVIASNLTPLPRRSLPTTKRPHPSPPVIGSTTPRSSSHRSRVSPTKVTQTTSRHASKRKTPVKVKPKHKSPIRHTIKKGDTLYALSRRYKTSVSSIQRANGLKGTNLRIGKTLIIPRY